jgi:hypothetical protein
MLRDTHHEYNSAFTNIITSINGLLFSNVLLLNTFFPKTYTKTFVLGSFSLLQSSYMSRDILWRIGFTGSQIMLIINPTKYLKRIEPPTNPTHAIENDTNDTNDTTESVPESVLIGYINTNPIEDQNTMFNDFVKTLNDGKQEIDVATTMIDLSTSKRGGNKKSYKKRRTRKSKQTRKQRRRKTKSKK